MSPMIIENAREAVRTWLDGYVIPMSTLDRRAVDGLAIVREFGEPDADGIYKVWVDEIISGANGSLKYQLFNAMILSDYMSSQPALEDTIEDFIILAAYASEELTKRTKLSGSYSIYLHEADGSIAIFYTDK